MTLPKDMEDNRPLQATVDEYDSDTSEESLKDIETTKNGRPLHTVEEEYSDSSEESLTKKKKVDFSASNGFD